MWVFYNNEYFVILNEAKRNEESVDNQIDSSIVGMTNSLQKSNYEIKRIFINLFFKNNIRVDFQHFFFKIFVVFR